MMDWLNTGTPWYGTLAMLATIVSAQCVLYYWPEISQRIEDTRRERRIRNLFRQHLREVRLGMPVAFAMKTWRQYLQECTERSPQQVARMRRE